VGLHGEATLLACSATLRSNGEDRLDLHVLFEAAGNEPEERLRVLDVIEELVRAGMLDACGGDFYALTEKGKGAAAQP
jgi:hypothetical protein